LARKPNYDFEKRKKEQERKKKKEEKRQRKLENRQGDDNPAEDGEGALEGHEEPQSGA
jgi:hypothetical protein